ncbi:ImmA/IrrE family metallo-endopeptidase [Desulfobulbus sp. US4]|nr:ImmA/IrrE family metallo-endopeptidase [Desulfobulbus sp. US4]
MRVENNIDLKLAEAECVARQIINEFGICSPEHIRVHDIAFAKGATVLEKPVAGAAASLVTLKDKAVIRIPPNENEERQRFSIAHELGHLVMNHVTSIQKVCTDTDMLNWYQSSLETQANFFASELLLPTQLVAPSCDIGTVNFDIVKEIAKNFRTSLTATAIKFVRLCPEPCAIVYSTNGLIKWFYKSSEWWPFIKPGQLLDKRTLAYDFFADRTMESEAQEVEADAWIEDTDLDEVFEHSFSSPQYGFVLSLLWIKPQ